MQAVNINDSLGIFSRWHAGDIFPENRIWQCMQIVSNGDNLNEMSKPVFWENKVKYFKMSSAEDFTQGAKR